MVLDYLFILRSLIDISSNISADTNPKKIKILINFKFKLPSIDAPIYSSAEKLIVLIVELTLLLELVVLKEDEEEPTHILVNKALILQ